MLFQNLKKYSVPIGFSDHSGNYLTSIASIAYGIQILEVHVIFDKRLFGPDTSSSITIDELREVVKFRNYFNKLKKLKVDKDISAKNLIKTKLLFNRSATANVSLLKNTLLKKNMIKFKKPGFGINELEIKKYIGKRLNKDINKNYQFKKRISLSEKSMHYC